MRNGISICHVDVRTAVGTTATTTAAAVRAGIVRVREHGRFVTPDGEFLKGAYDPALPDDLAGWERLAALATPVLTQFEDALPWLTRPDAACHLFLALPEHNPGFTEQDERSLVNRVRKDHPTWTVAPTKYGHAGALSAFEQAALLLEHRKAQWCIVGGVDSYFHGLTLDGLLHHRRIQTPEIRSGFAPGEGAGFVLLTTEQIRRTVNLPMLGTVSGFASEVAATTWNRPEVNRARALTKVIRRASAPLLGRGEVCDAIFGDINGERYRTDEWSTAQLRLHNVFRYEPGKPATYETAARCCGDLGAATGPVHVALATEAWLRGYARGRSALVFGGSDAGLRSAIILEQARS